MFPIFNTGNSDEYLRCLTYDDTSQMIIAAGKTTSNDFAPAQNDHGFIFALDWQGNWRWGNFFYNVSYAVSTVTGCKLSSKKNYMTILGVANSLRIVMILNKEDGSIEKFFTVTTMASYTTTPKFQTHNAIYFEEEDPFDKKPYVYLSFLMNTYYMKIVKFSYDAEEFDISYNKFLYTAATT